MPLDVPDGSVCLVDSNILYYALVPTDPVSEPCLRLLDRALLAKVWLFVSVPVLSDALHKMMIAEVAHLTGRDRAGLVGYLGRNPELISRLTLYPQALERLLRVPMTVLPVDERLLADATMIAVQSRLPTNDALIVALMRRHQIRDLITNDDDFDGVSDITVWKPR